MELLLRRSKRGWAWNQFYLMEEYMGDNMQYVGKVRRRLAKHPCVSGFREHLLSFMRVCSLLKCQSVHPSVCLLTMSVDHADHECVCVSMHLANIDRVCLLHHTSLSAVFTCLSVRGPRCPSLISVHIPVSPHVCQHIC